MAMYPKRDGVYMMTEPGSFVPGANKDVVRIVMHQTSAPQSIHDQAPINARVWTDATRLSHVADPNSQFGISAHFTVEWDGRIFQHVDTDDGAKGTGAYAFNAIHIEFASLNQPMTNDQLFYGADLMAWITSVHPNVRLVTVGDSNSNPGDTRQRGITCHSFVEIVGKLDKPKTFCPGAPIIQQMNTIAVLASVRALLP